jgi:hypothetical protein
MDLTILRLVSITLVGMRDDSEIKLVKLQRAFNCLPSCYISSFADAVTSVHRRFLNTYHIGILAAVDEDDVCESSHQLPGVC